MGSVDLFDMSYDYLSLFTEQSLGPFGGFDYNLECVHFPSSEVQLHSPPSETATDFRSSLDVFEGIEPFLWQNNPVSTSDIYGVEFSCVGSVVSNNSSSTPSSISSNATQAKDRISKKRERGTSSKSDTAKNTNKANLNDSIIVFTAKPNAKVRTRVRKSFGPDRRKEVALNRFVGACIQCKLRKVSCNVGDSCDQCIKRAGSATLGQELCCRQRLLTTRFRNIDLLSVTRFQQLLYQNQTRLPGTQREVFVFWPTCCHPGLPQLLKVQVQETLPQSSFSYADGQIDATNQVVRHIKYSVCTESFHSDTPSIILHESLPSIDSLLQSCADTNHWCNSGPFVQLHRAFGHFGRRYCSLDESLPLQDLMRRILRMKRLVQIYKQAPCMQSNMGGDAQWAPSSIKMQLRHHIGKEITSLEVHILHELDSLVYGSEKMGRNNVLPIWACLWLLMLTYRSLFSTLHWFYMRDVAARNSLYGLATHIYHTLTSIYAALFGATSPLTLDWRKEEVYEMLGRDDILVNAFCIIKTEMTYFYGARAYLFSEDALLKTLVVENEFKLVESQKRDARRKGLL